MKRITLIIAALIIASFALPALAGPLTDMPLKEIAGCGKTWGKDKACDFKLGKHDYRIKQPNIKVVDTTVLIELDFDRKKSMASDDHWAADLEYKECGKRASAKFGERKDGKLKEKKINDDWEKTLKKLVGDLNKKWRKLIPEHENCKKEAKKEEKK